MSSLAAVGVATGPGAGLPERHRCPWCGSDPLYVRYHDLEWGQPVHEERLHFEFLLLETMQAGLSWYTILAKRENYRLAFDSFEWRKVMAFDEARVEQLMQNPGIIRNRAKILGAVRNASAFEKIRQEFGSFDAYIWSWTGGRPLVNARRSLADLPVTTPLSDRLAADMKQRGFSYVGSVTIYSHLQAIGVVNDHLVECFRWAELGGTLSTS
jgi:DNA-3-methyladenine glycosylase I